MVSSVPFCKVLLDIWWLYGPSKRAGCWNVMGWDLEPKIVACQGPSVGTAGLLPSLLHVGAAAQSVGRFLPPLPSPSGLPY